MQTCDDCKHWKPDIFIDYIGACLKKEKATTEGEVRCESYEVKAESEFMWCRTCRTTVHSSERTKHKDHKMHESAHSDHDAHEYLRSGD